MTREEKLIRKMEQGDEAAMRELIGIYYLEILRYCLWHVPERTLAEDAAQETFLKAIRHMDTYAHRGKFKAFLYKIAANTCVDICRKKWWNETSLENLADSMSYTEEGYEKAHEDMQLRHLVRNLKPQLQEIVILRYGQNLSIREIGEVEGIPLRTVQSRLRTALKLIKTDWEKEMQK